MREDTEGWSQVATADAAEAIAQACDGLEPSGNDERTSAPQIDRASGRRRFTWAAVVATVIVSIPLLWIFSNLPQTTSAASGPIHENNYYELQARAIFHGHLWLPDGALGIEGFIHAGHQYTYFGLFPALLRMPILLATSAFDGKLTDASILLAWLLTAVFAGLLLWRVRILANGSVAMGWMETISYGMLMATALGGTVFTLLAAQPDVFQEDLAWSICLTVGCLFALIGVLEQPSWGRVIGAGALMLATNLDRVTTGWACLGAAALVAAWFGAGRGGREHRRWALPMAAAGLIPLVVACAINYAKFGVPFGVSNYDQVFTRVNVYRRVFLASNHNSEAGVHFIPSTLLAYLRPDGIRITGVFPFITLPASPPPALGGVLFDRRYRTASLTSSMPLLFLLGCWGAVSAFRPRPMGRVALTRIPMLAAAIAGCALFVWGYIAPRYLADFVPLLVLASSVGMADVWRRLERSDRPHRVMAMVAISLVGIFAIAANVAMALTPNEEWDTSEVRHYVAVQKAFSDVTGHPLQGRVAQGSALPPWAPADQLFVVGQCDGLYVSNGEYFNSVPDQQYHRNTWMVVERGHRFQHTYRITFRQPAPSASTSVELVRAGSASVRVSVTGSAQPGQLLVSLGRYGVGGPVNDIPAVVRSGSTHKVVVITDPAKHVVSASLDGQNFLATSLNDMAPSQDLGSSRSPGPDPALSVVAETPFSPEPTLCFGLTH